MTFGLNQIEFDIFIGNDGTEYSLKNNYNKSLVIGVSGQGMPPIDYLTQTGPFQHGATVLDYRLRPRTLQFVHRVNSCSRNEYWNLRTNLINALRPNRHDANNPQPGTLRKILPDGTRRDIDVFIDTGPEFRASGGNWDEFSIQEGIRLIAHNPTFYNPDTSTVTFSFTALTELVFPITFSITFGSSTINENQMVTYTGTWLSYPTIVIAGPLEAPVITNSTTSQVFQLNYNVSNGEVVTINLEYGNKTVVSSTAGNLIGSVDPSSDFSWSIQPDPVAPNGVNTINVQGAGAVVGSTGISLSYLIRYIAI